MKYAVKVIVFENGRVTTEHLVKSTDDQSEAFYAFNAAIWGDENKKILDQLRKALL